MKLLLQNDQEPGDILMLTAAVRDLHLSHPGQFKTAVKTPWPELWLHNPFVIPLEQMGEPDRTYECADPLIHFSNQRPYHFIHGFMQHLAWRLGVSIKPTEFRGDIHLSVEERSKPSPLLGPPYWIIVAGGKYDFTAKWWNPASYQRVVDHFCGKIRFVQCGAQDHWHPALSGVTNLIGKTSLREMVLLMYHADGLVCPVTFAMHLAAAVPLRPDQVSRPCVVVAGGREPVQWEAYPGHQFLHTQGALECCATGGCWKSRCQPVGDGDAKDNDLCVKPVKIANNLIIPRCMDLITPQRVIEAIELHYEGGALRYATN
jgi:ADP-heptose:LPS heptosyltransferase